MKRKLSVVALIVACFMTLAVCAGCAQTQGGTGTAANQEQTANRAYMSEVNQIMSSLNEKLDAFVDAVSRGDAVGVKTQADRALSVLDQMDSLEAPEALADVHDAYKRGCSSMRQALQDYSNLYADGQVASAETIAPIQQAYDEGVKAFEEADKLAAEKA